MKCDRASGAEAGGINPPVVGAHRRESEGTPLKGTPSDLHHAGEFGGMPGLFMLPL